MEAIRGYHVQMPDLTPLADAPILYSDRNILVTPMAGRLRASSFMEFAASDAPADPRKTTWLRKSLRDLGYACDPAAPGWVGPRPVLPDYLPAIGSAVDLPGLHYAFAHQHIGLTLIGGDGARRGRPRCESTTTRPRRLRSAAFLNPAPNIRSRVAPGAHHNLTESPLSDGSSPAAVNLPTRLTLFVRTATARAV